MSQVAVRRGSSVPNALRCPATDEAMQSRELVLMCAVSQNPFASLFATE
jgi:hypothetical protein